MRPRIFLDMDEVLVDFVGGACRRWGVTVEAVRSNWPVGEWDIVPPLSKVVNAVPRGQRPDWSALTEAEFWRHIHDRGPDFWCNLEPHPWLEDLLTAVRAVTPDWYIVSSPSRCPSSHAGKATWLKRYFGPLFDRFLLTPHKHLLAGPGAVLIDDREETVERFVAHGGRGILFPAYHNSRHADRDRAAELVIGELGRLANEGDK